MISKSLEESSMSKSLFKMFSLITMLALTLMALPMQSAQADALGDYRSVASGNWNSISTWETFNGTSWVAATATPTNSDGVITIRNGHTVTITASVTYD